MAVVYVFWGGVQGKYIKILRSLTLKVYTISRRVGEAIARSD
ncbi:hypothetical protein [Phormidium nigroviride]